MANYETIEIRADQVKPEDTVIDKFLGGHIYIAKKVELSEFCVLITTPNGSGVTFNLDEKLDKKIAMEPEKIKYIEAILTNDEESTDQELIELFMKETGISKVAAERAIKQRNEYLKL